MKQNKETKAVLMTKEDGQAAFDAVVTEASDLIRITSYNVCYTKLLRLLSRIR